ncbi:MAG: TlpA disulfide reductase family protein, partial [Chloroflexi bacterium]|nr:TlpA disulfide reductase family protein [Chloroflexota bacterium]
SNEAKDMLTQLNGGKLPVKQPDEIKARPVCPKVGCRALDFNLTTTGGQSMSLNSLKRKKAILVFTTGDCSSCKEMIRSVQQVYDYWPRQQLEVVVILSQIKSSDVESWVKQNNVKCPVALDSAGEMTNRYKPDRIPAAYFIDGDGNIKAKRYDPLSSSEVDALLRLF